jgi:hypothetical protein
MNITKHEGKYYREVKRVAKVGELVKVVSTDAKRPVKDTYQLGDIFTADPKNTIYPGYVFISAGQLTADEYVVLEPLTVMTDEPHPEIAEGSTFVVVYRAGDVQQGRVVTLSRNDDEKPLFENNRYWLSWYHLSPLNIIYKDKPKTIDFKVTYCEHCGHVMSVEELPVKRVYTAEQIQEAKDIVYRLMTKSKNKTYAFQTDGKETICKAIYRNGRAGWSEGSRATAICSDGDMWSCTVGQLVSICKLTDTDCPSWVRGK